jgi:hypothetical protein
VREKVTRTLLVALFSYAAAIPLIYLFIRKVYGLGEAFAYACVGIAVLLTLPVLTIRAVRTYREMGDGPSSTGQSAPAKALWLRTGLAMVGTIVAGAGMVIVLDGHGGAGTLVAITGAATVVGAARSIIGLTRPPTAPPEGDLFSR